MSPTFEEDEGYEESDDNLGEELSEKVESTLGLVTTLVDLITELQRENKTIQKENEDFKKEKQDEMVFADKRRLKSQLSVKFKQQLSLVDGFADAIEATGGPTPKNGDGEEKPLLSMDK